MNTECTNPEIGELISLYEFGQLEETQKKHFENHILECDFCFHQLYELAPVMDQLRNNPYLYLSDLKSEKHENPIKGFLNTINSFFSKHIIPIPYPIRIAAPVIATLLIIFVLSFPLSDQRFSKLATIEPVQYISLSTRSAESIPESEKLFYQAMRFYSEQEYEKAIEMLQLSLQKGPDNPEYHFYLGLCYLLVNETDQAMELFRKGIALGDNPFSEKFHWYLANAFLLKNDEKNALIELQHVLNYEGNYELDAQKLIHEIQQLIGQK